MARRPALPADDQAGEAPRLIELVRSTVPPMHPAGFPFVAAGLGVAALGRRSRFVRTTGLSAAAACAMFFRHPARMPPTRDGVVVAPADGVVTICDEAVPPTELGLPATPVPRVSIFLSLFDVHVQRVPVSGDVIDIKYRPGKFGSADRPRSSDENERNSMLIRTPGGADVVVVQIAGLLARRIVCDAKVGDKVSIGATYGLIRFGSRLDTYLPAGATVAVSPGQRSVGAETVLGEFTAPEKSQPEKSQ